MRWLRQFEAVEGLPGAVLWVLVVVLRFWFRLAVTGSLVEIVTASRAESLAVFAAMKALWKN